jgi:hypothetical protein
MNHEDNQLFLQYLENHLYKDNYLYLTANNDKAEGFYFYGHDRLTISITSQGNSINFYLYESLSANQALINLANVDMPFSECENFLKKAFSIYTQNAIEMWTNQYPQHLDYIYKEIEYIKEELKHINHLSNSTKINKDSKIEIMHEGKNHIINPGSVFEYVNSTPCLCNLVGIKPINVTLESPDRGKDIFMQLPFSGWEFIQYPTFKPFIHVTKGMNSLNQLIEVIKEISPEQATSLHYYTLENKLNINNESNVKKHKI